MIIYIDPPVISYDNDLSSTLKSEVSLNFDLNHLVNHLWIFQRTIVSFLVLEEHGRVYLLFLNNRYPFLLNSSMCQKVSYNIYDLLKNFLSFSFSLAMIMKNSIKCFAKIQIYTITLGLSIKYTFIISIYLLRDRCVHFFLKVIRPKVNVMPWLKFGFAYTDVAVQARDLQCHWDLSSHNRWHYMSRCWER